MNKSTLLLARPSANKATCEVDGSLTDVIVDPGPSAGLLEGPCSATCRQLKEWLKCPPPGPQWPRIPTLTGIAQAGTLR